MKHLVTLKDWSSEEIQQVLDLADELKREPSKYYDTMHRKVLVMIFEKPSLRTRVSFETGMCQMGGDAIYYDMSTSPLGSGKENIHDTIKVLSRYADIVMARLFSHASLEEMVKYGSIPVINGLTNYTHPCQILADLQTVREHKGALKGLTLAYLGDAFNNVTHSLLFGCAKVGMNIRVGCPAGKEYSPDPQVLADAQAFGAISGAEVRLTHDAAEAVKGADVVYTDSWMSYHIPEAELDARVRVFRPYQVNAELMAHANKEAIFMNCLPAIRGYEQTAEVMDGPQSVVFDEAENRLHMHKAVMVHLLNQA
ncbi:MAG: ornithine carbamoyltransferase [Kiritimatiellae bacterium]|nr:ornithine carbamoyltransferase [Kiritimatiellia bacterium]